MEHIFEILGKVVVAVGGAGVIIIAISGYISKLFADWFLQKEKAKYQKEIEEYKQQIQKELEVARNLNEEIAYKKRVIFDSEYKYYIEIVPKLISAAGALTLYIATKLQLRDGDEENYDILNEIVIEKKKIAKEDLYSFYEHLSMYAVFIEKDVYEEMMYFFDFGLDILEEKQFIDEDGEVMDLDEILTMCANKEENVIDFLRNKIRK